MDSTVPRKFYTDNCCPLRRRVEIPPDRLEVVLDAVGTWEFSAHEFSDDELLHAAMLMLQHALTMPDLERWRIATGEPSLHHHKQVDPINLRLSRLSRPIRTSQGNGEFLR